MDMATDMMPHSVDLGRLDLVSTTSDLQAQLTSRIQLDPFDQDHNIQKSTKDFLTDNTRLRPWLCSSRLVQLVLELHIPEHVEVLHREDLLRSVATSMREAKLWHQLRLRACGIETSFSDVRGIHSIAVSLEHSDENPAGKQRCSHKLGTDLPFNAVKPPQSVPSWPLKLARLSLIFKGKRMCKRPKLPLSSDVLATFKALEHDEGLSPVGYGSPAEELLEVETGDYASYRQGSESQQDFDELLPIGLGHPAAMAKADDCAVVEPGVNSAAAVGCHPSLKRACGEHELDDRWTKPVELPDILQFVDAALRVSISNQPRRLGKGIKAKRSTQLKKLADVAPSLWAPGYLQNVSSRAVFLPTICHALANVASHSSRDNRFQSKFEKMTRYNAEDGRTMPELQEDLAARLWYLLQDGVVDGTAAQRLEPLSFHASAPAEHDQHLPELLEPQRDHQLASDTSQDIILDDGWDNGWDDEWDYAWDDELEDCLERLEDSAASDACDDDRLESLVLDQRKLPNEKVWNGTAKDPDTPDLLAGRIGSQTASSEVIQPCFTWQYDLLPR